MSIKGFEVGGVQERYDYTALDNTPANLVQDGNYVHTDNNYTNADKTKLDGIATGANKTIIDATLTQSGQAADAKATGDELDDLKSAFTANLIHDTASGSIANFPDGAALPVRDLSVDIEPVQAGSGDPSPDNVRPISGWTGASVKRTGKNLFSYNNITRKQIYRATLRPMGDGLNSFYLCGAPGRIDEAILDVESWAYVTAFIGFRVKGETAITVSCKVKNYTADCNGFIRVRYNTTENRDGSTVVNTVFFNTVETSNISISGTIPSGNYVFFEFSPASKGESVTLTQYAEVTDFQFEIGSTATAYEPYQGETYSITFPAEAGTVYGGTLDVTTGKLTVDMKKVTYDGSNDEFWSRQSLDSNRFYIATHDLKKLYDYRNNLIADKLKTAENQNWVQEFSISGYRDSNGTYPAQNWIYIQHTAETNAEELKSWLHDNPVTVAYTLATPIVYDLTPTEVSTLLGTNNIFADCGDTTVDYYADPTLYINKKIAAAVAAMS